MATLAPGWDLHVDRGPDWLFIRPHALEIVSSTAGADTPELIGATPRLADAIWGVLELHMIYRLVLELDGVDRLSSELLGELTTLHARIQEHDGLMRLCGLSAANHESLRRARLDGCFPRYGNREEAVMASRPMQPR